MFPFIERGEHGLLVGVEPAGEVPRVLAVVAADGVDAAENDGVVCEELIGADADEAGGVEGAVDFFLAGGAGDEEEREVGEGGERRVGWDVAETVPCEEGGEYVVDG